MSKNIENKENFKNKIEQIYKHLGEINIQELDVKTCRELESHLRQALQYADNLENDNDNNKDNENNNDNDNKKYEQVKISYKTYYEDPTISANGTHLMESIRVNYNQLVNYFGNPLEGDGYKVDAQWIIKFSDGLVATIYNWKDGKNYCGEKGIKVEDIKEWNIGGLESIVVQHIKSVLKKK